MRGFIYEVTVNGQLIKLVGSTTLTLKQRRCASYVKRFGPAVELRLIREVPRPENYSDSDYNFYLKACEAMDIARKGTWVESGGLNKISPLVQALWKPFGEAEMGRIGGRISGRINGCIAGHLTGTINGRIAGRKAVESGRLRKMCTSEVCSKGGRRRIELHGNPGTMKGWAKAGKKAVESGHLASIVLRGACTRWNINRGKSCVCGKH